MRMGQAAARSIDEYIARYPSDVREILEKVRTTIQRAAPAAEEAIRYNLPTFTLHGNLVHFGAWKNHIGFYPTSSGTRTFAKELAGYECSKGAVRFPFDRPVPYALVRRIVTFRVKECVEVAALEANKQRRRTPRP